MAKASYTALCQLGEEREVLLQDPLQVWSGVDNLLVGTGGSSYKHSGLRTAMTPLPAGPSEHPLLSFAFPVLRERGKIHLVAMAPRAWPRRLWVG